MTSSRGPVPRDVRRAIEFLRKSISRPFVTAELIAHCGLSERALRHHFRVFLDQTPTGYLRRLRLVAVREALLSGGPATSVAEVALEHQFNHPGRFARQYRQHFGEAPSTTLRRSRRAGFTAPSQSAARATRSHQAESAVERYPALSSREKPSIAVLPFRTTALGPGESELADSMSEAVAAALSAAGWLSVLAPQSARAAQLDPLRIGREQGARYLLLGRFLPSGSRMRLILRVLETAEGHHLWGSAFDGERAEPLALQDRVVENVQRAVPSRILGAEIDRAQRTDRHSLGTRGLAMRALPYLFASRRDGALHALDLLHGAIETDPDHGLATALAAWGHGQLVMYNATDNPAAERETARQLAQRAAILDDLDPIMLTARCAVHMMEGEFDTAKLLVDRALAADPTCGWAWGRSGWLHSYRGDSAPAITDFQKALRFAPRGMVANICAGIGSACFNAGDYEAAASWLRKALLRDPGTAWVNRSLSVSYTRLGDRLEALRSLERLRRYSPGVTVSRVVAAVPFRQDFLNRLGEGLSDLGLPQ